MIDVHVGDKVSFAYEHRRPVRSANVEFYHRRSGDPTKLVLERTFCHFYTITLLFIPLQTQPLYFKL